jgi:hypothetical protein
MEPTGDRIAGVARQLRDCVTTANFTDNPLGVPRLSGLACALHSLTNDIEPFYNCKHAIAIATTLKRRW